MATIRVTGTTLQVDTAFFHEGDHPNFPDELLPRLKGLAGVSIVPTPEPQATAKTPKPKE